MMGIYGCIGNWEIPGYSKIPDYYNSGFIAFSTQAIVGGGLP
jgi:hypothetical protein